MKSLSITKSLCLVLAYMVLASCNSNTGRHIESDIENPKTSADTVQAEMSTENGAVPDNDASRLSDGKDSVDGEVTPPNVKEQ
ncbi:hypothetical protein [Sphingobacterium siyangense]|uniref:hypothetical protein n=1 Tax=Sphingobacterium siyangense TaxID=459529 RepID=UPI0019647434|nr:hypothetical protein [Sphingobacterium siyangense]QRY55486.1 hypothetical protein JVX97_15710 [Sphingobacterium siyangense]